MIADGSDDGGDKVVTFPTTAEERRALRKAKQDRERQRLVNVFIDEAGGDQALFRTPDNIAYADVIIAGHRETWPVRSVQFRHAYVRYLRQQLDRFLDTDPAKALMAKAAMSKAAVNAALDDFETRAICSMVREVYTRVAEHNGDIYIDMANADWHAIRVTSAGWSVVEAPPVRFIAPPAPWHYRCQPVAPRSMRCGRC